MVDQSNIPLQNTIKAKLLIILKEANFVLMAEKIKWFGGKARI